MPDIFVYWCHWSLAGWHALFCTADERHGITITAHENSRHFLIYNDGETTCNMLISWCFYVEIFFIYEQDKESTTPWLWQIDTCDSCEVKWFQICRILIWNRFIPHLSQSCTKPLISHLIPNPSDLHKDTESAGFVYVSTHRGRFLRSGQWPATDVLYFHRECGWPRTNWNPDQYTPAAGSSRLTLLENGQN